MVLGTPISVFWFPSFLRVLYRREATAAMNSLVVVFPTLPVTPTVMGENWLR